MQLKVAPVFGTSAVEAVLSFSFTVCYCLAGCRGRRSIIAPILLVGWLLFSNNIASHDPQGIYIYVTVVSQHYFVQRQQTQAEKSWQEFETILSDSVCCHAKSTMAASCLPC